VKRLPKKAAQMLAMSAAKRLQSREAKRLK
jgi:hypothetical protein